jgi:hypothetical protein
VDWDVFIHRWPRSRERPGANKLLEQEAAQQAAHVCATAWRDSRPTLQHRQTKHCFITRSALACVKYTLQRSDLRCHVTPPGPVKARWIYLMGVYSILKVSYLSLARFCGL